MPTSPTCIFCKIVAGKLPAEVVYETDQVLAFMDIQPAQAGHVLLIPKDHYKMMDVTPDDVIRTVFVEAKHLMKGIKKAMKADYVSISVVGKDVPHLHVHLMPRYLDDKLKPWPVQKYKAGEMEKAAEKIRSKV